LNPPHSYCQRTKKIPYQMKVYEIINGDMENSNCKKALFIYYNLS